MMSVTSSHESRLHSPPSSPSKLGMADVANIFVRMRRTSKSKSYHIDLSSGESQTHPSLAGDGVTFTQKVEVELVDEFVCANGVNVARLLRATRATLLEMVTLFQANALVDEKYVNLWHTSLSFDWF